MDRRRLKFVLFGLAIVVSMTFLLVLVTFRTWRSLALVIGSLLMGVTAAKTLSWVWGKPLVAVNHVLAHACSPAIEVQPPPWPAVARVFPSGENLVDITTPLWTCNVASSRPESTSHSLAVPS